MRPIASFIAERIPQYGREDFEWRGYENLLGQRALWSGLAFLAMGKARSCIEVRLAASKERRVELSINILPHTENRLPLDDRIGDFDPGSSAKDAVVRQLARLLPTEYGWRRGVALFDSSENSSDDAWRVARVVRRVEFIDLPYHSLLLTRSRGGTGSFSDVGESVPRQPAGQTGMAPTDTAETPAPATDGAPAGNVLATLLGSVGGQPGRALPEAQTHGSELLARRFCLPLLGAIDGTRPRPRRLLEELLNAAPAVISFCVRPLAADEAELSRQVAVNLKRFLTPFAADIASSGFSEFQALQAIYDRYSLPEAYLTRTSIRVAAAHDEHAVSVATLVGATLGGLRAFVIDPPSRNVDLGQLRRDFDVPPAIFSSLRSSYSEDSTPSIWNKEYWLSWCFSKLNSAGVILPHDESLVDFLQRLPHIYSLEEVERLTQLPMADEEGLPGLDTRLVAPFSDPSQAGAYPAYDSEGAQTPAPVDRIRIGIASTRAGVVLDADRASSTMEGDWHTISPNDLTKHAFIVGSTGSGKTVTTLFLVRELARLDIPFLIVEPVKTEYHSHLEKIPHFGLRRRSFEGTSEGKPVSDFLAFDPMRLQSGVSVARHASYLKSCFEAAFPLDPVLAMILDAGIRGYYTDQSEYGCKLGILSRGGRAAHRWEAFEGTKRGRKLGSTKIVHPSLAGFQIYFLDVFLPTVVQVGENQPKIAELYEQWRQIFQRRFEALSSGMIGAAARKADWLFLQDEAHYDPFAELLTGRTILELDGIPDDEHKALMMAFIMTFLFERRQADDLAARERKAVPEDRLRHVLVVEEAHRILANTARSSRGELAGANAQSKSVSLFVDMLAEIRAFGQGLVIVEQIPTKIVPEAVKNTNLKIMLRLTAADDREYLGEAMNFSDQQKRFVTSLRAVSGRGVDMVVFEQQLDQPRLLTLPLPDDRTLPIHDRLFPARS